LSGRVADPRVVTRPGIDLIEIERIERALERRPRLAERLFRPGELAYAAAHRRPARHLAARFAAKEAAIKALGGEAAPRDIEVVGSRPPALLLHGPAAAAAERRGVSLEVSLTHSREVAAAVVVATPRGPDEAGARGPAAAAGG
jgi:holo-[acyl-carrier protein] synthase